MTPKERDACIAHKYLEENATAASLAEEFGLSVPRIYQILQDQGVSKGGSSAPRAPKGEGGKVVSQVHVNIGLKLYHQRKLLQNVERDIVSEQLKWSVKRIALVEKGEYQLSLSEFLQLAEYLQISPAQLIEDCTATGSGVMSIEEDKESSAPAPFSVISGSRQKTS